MTKFPWNYFDNILQYIASVRRVVESPSGCLYLALDHGVHSIPYESLFHDSPEFRSVKSLKPLSASNNRPGEKLILEVDSKIKFRCIGLRHPW